MPTVRPTLRQICTVATARATFTIPEENFHEGALVSDGTLDVEKLGLKAVRVRSQRLLTLEELVGFIVSDPDGDGVRSLVDASPRNPFVQKRVQLKDKDGDGHPAWCDIDDNDPARWETGNPAIDEWDHADPMEAVVAMFSSTEEIAEQALIQNQAERLYDANALIQAAHQAGVDGKTCAEWRQRFVGGGE